eukprot:4262998-Karenia_brevis.AAC.1
MEQGVCAMMDCHQFVLAWAKEKVVPHFQIEIKEKAKAMEMERKGSEFFLPQANKFQRDLQ